MRWTDFLLLYFALIVGLLFLARGMFSNRWADLAKVTLAVTNICFISDYIAEDRSFWEFPHASGLNILEVPIENIVFTVLTVQLALVIFLLPRRSARKYR